MTRKHATSLAVMAVSGLSLLACSSSSPGLLGDGDGDEDSDAGLDASSPAADAAPSTKADTGTPATDSGGAGGGGVDGSSCSPVQPTATATHGYHPPLVETVCTSAQLSAYISACGAQGTSASCTAFFDDGANATCLGCIRTSTSADSWGAVIQDPASGEQFANTAGCIVTLDSSSAAHDCAVAREAVTFCQTDACDAPCAGLPYDDLTSCESTAYAIGGVCGQERVEADCTGGLDSAAQGCVGSDYDTILHVVGTALCVGQ